MVKFDEMITVHRKLFVLLFFVLGTVVNSTWHWVWLIVNYWCLSLLLTYLNCTQWLLDVCHNFNTVLHIILSGWNLRRHSVQVKIFLSYQNTWHIKIMMEVTSPHINIKYKKETNKCVYVLVFKCCNILCGGYF